MATVSVERSPFARIAGRYFRVITRCSSDNAPSPFSTLETLGNTRQTRIETDREKEKKRDDDLVRLSIDHVTFFGG